MAEVLLMSDAPTPDCGHYTAYPFRYVYPWSGLAKTGHQQLVKQWQRFLKPSVSDRFRAGGQRTRGTLDTDLLCLVWPANKDVKSAPRQNRAEGKNKALVACVPDGF